MSLSIKEKYGWIGKLKIVKKDIITGKTTERFIFNRLMNNALDEIIKALYTTPNLYLAHVAIGDDDTANSDTLTSLYNEIYRVPILNRIRTGTGELESRGILLDTEPPDLSGACTIKEIGFFCGSASYNWNGGVGSGTGIMISRIVLSPSESKTNTEQINFVRTDEFIRG